ncbi:hypothetical protein [Flavobacterium gawalongense]|uniref:Uncharacterized protein n=1 Tax=Flavobacterium gawalongense TaxID=2594432 RepID=A0A553BD79_9FLAO|nr:hypothetical protein [Flavobacterium gawalongense]TRX06186.1 hypothetical protein FNW11_14900 [Flavobacterium gawalongense]
MNRIEFSDINRFLTSLGTIFIGLAFLLPWFIIQNNSIILIEQEKIKQLTPTAKEIIQNQQNTLLTINCLFPTFSFGLIVLGFILLLIGLLRWNKRQAISDKIQNEDLKSKEILNLSAEAKREIIANEIESAADNDLDIDGNLNQDIDNYLNIENRIYSQLSEYYKKEYSPFQNIKIGDFNYDVILKSKDILQKSDRIIEIRFYKNSILLESLKDAGTQLALSAKNYDKTFRRRSSSILLVIYSGNEYDLNLENYRKTIREYCKTLGKIVNVKFIKETEIENYRPENLLRSINI